MAMASDVEYKNIDGINWSLEENNMTRTYIKEAMDAITTAYKTNKHIRYFGVRGDDTGITVGQELDPSYDWDYENDRQSDSFNPRLREGGDRNISVAHILPPLYKRVQFFFYLFSFFFKRFLQAFHRFFLRTFRLQRHHLPFAVRISGAHPSV